MVKKAIITGIMGQDGSYLGEFLLKKGYEVHGIIRMNSVYNNKSSNIAHIEKDLILHKVDLTNYSKVRKIIHKIIPDECYHLSAMSFVDYSHNNEFLIMNKNTNSTHYLLSTLREVNKKCKFFFAGSSEMFGNPSTSPQTESTPFNPKTIYGISKVTSYFLVKKYREKENMFTCTGIMYNHESPRRGKQFVTKKIVRSAVRIKKGLQEELFLGNIDAKRDWGYAPDYVIAMWKILQNNKADDFIISTGVTHSIREFLDITFSYLDLNYKDYLKIDDKLFRIREDNILCGDCSKINNEIKWKNHKTLSEIIEKMIKAELAPVSP